MVEFASMAPAYARKDLQEMTAVHVRIYKTNDLERKSFINIFVNFFNVCIYYFQIKRFYKELDIRKRKKKIKKFDY